MEQNYRNFLLLAPGKLATCLGFPLYVPSQKKESILYSPPSHAVTIATLFQ